MSNSEAPERIYLRGPGLGMQLYFREQLNLTDTEYIRKDISDEVALAELREMFPDCWLYIDQTIRYEPEMNPDVRLSDGYGEHYIRLEPLRGLILQDHLARQREWSERTFGPGARAKGVVDHIRKELIEVEKKPQDLSKWIDVAILALDGAWRAGYSPEEITSLSETWRTLKMESERFA